MKRIHSTILVWGGDLLIPSCFQKIKYEFLKAYLVLFLGRRSTKIKGLKEVCSPQRIPQQVEVPPYIEAKQII
jgi:hypothetical protein